MMAAIILTAVLLMIICLEGAYSITGMCIHGRRYGDDRDEDIFEHSGRHNREL